MTTYELLRVSEDELRAVWDELREIDSDNVVVEVGEPVVCPEGLRAVFEDIQGMVLSQLRRAEGMGVLAMNESDVRHTVVNSLLMVAVRFGAQLGERRMRPGLDFGGLEEGDEE